MRQMATTLTLLLVFAACSDPVPPTTPTIDDDAAKSAVELIMAELADARTLEVSAEFHGQTVEERIDHLTGLLQWFADDAAADGEDPDTIPQIDTAFTMVALKVVPPPDFAPELPEMMAGMIWVYTKANLPGAIAHVTKWDFGSYANDFTIPEHLEHEKVDAIPGDELMTEIGCFYLPNETGLPNERVDYWAYARSHHVYVTTVPFYYREDRHTDDLEDTRNPTYNPEFAGIPCAPGVGM